MQNYSFVPPSAPPREGHKNYVFVDEHNRHKRLKVMRACNGCRKRKIKCDAATTNTWPCSACTRLKLVCVPPAIGQDGDFSTVQGFEPDPTDTVGASGTIDPSHFPIPQTFRETDQSIAGSSPSYNDTMGAFPQFIHTPPGQRNFYGDLGPSPMAQPHQPYQSQMFADPRAQSLETDNSLVADSDQSTAENLSEVLGELKIDETGIAPYIRQQKKGQAEPEIPVQDEVEENLPPLSTGAGSTIRIPPELMPEDDEAMHYFRIYFDDIHPYVPVIHRSNFYYQWQSDRHSISPLLLEALFACAGRVSDDPAQGAQWLAMANRHESSFMDVPRLSTIQALLLLLKARESLPKKGYFYRSWQTVKTIVSMAKDLDIQEHYSAHAEGKPCDLSPAECLVQTRVWQCLLVVEMMVGAPQGRSDFGVGPETVDMRPVLDSNGLDQFEFDRSRQFVYFVRNAHHIRIIADVYHKIKKQKDWGADPKLVDKNPLFTDWLHNLPPDLQIHYPPDGSPPWIPSHFVANMHSHCHLGIIMLHRPQLLASKSFAAGGGWKVHMALCYSSAKALCRLQESIMRQYGLSGLLFMQRGVSFAIYCILTCTMLHLVAITSPDPQFNADARDYFTRHMRVLEECSSAWPMPEIQGQIEALRLAFSADVNQSFELKPTFPYGSPSEPNHSSPPLDSQYQPQSSQVPTAVQSRLGYGVHPITPPLSTGTEESKPDPSRLQSLGMVPAHPVSRYPMDVPLVDENSWDPTRIINQWDMAFPIAPSSINRSPPAPMAQPVPTAPLPNQYSVPYDSSSKMPSAAPPPVTQPVTQPQFGGEQQVMMTARDWQQSVASVYDPHGLKRRWNHSADFSVGNTPKRRL